MSDHLPTGPTVANGDGGPSGTASMDDDADVTSGNQYIATSPWLHRLSFDHRFDNRGEVYCYEISSGTERDGSWIQLHHHISSSPDPCQQRVDARSLRNFWEAKGPTSHSRLVIVEDICTPLIELLGNSMGLDPLLFIQHLKGSGISKESFDRLTANDCIEAFLRNPVIATQWYRPVKRIPRDPRHRSKRTFSFSQSGCSDEDSDSETPGLRMRKLERPLGREGNNIIDTNIFRDAWQIGEIDSTDHEDHGSVLAAWEEKATVYRETRNGIEFGQLPGHRFRLSLLTRVVIGSHHSHRPCPCVKATQKYRTGPALQACGPEVDIPNRQVGARPCVSKVHSGTQKCPSGYDELDDGPMSGRQQSPFSKAVPLNDGRSPGSIV